MANRIFVDTAYVVALVNVKDENHEKAMELLDFYENSLLIISDAVLLEVGNALARNFKQKAVEIIEGFVTSDEAEVVRLDEYLFEKAFELYKSRVDKNWGLADCVSFVVMTENKVSDALTCDKHFVQAGFRALMLDSEN
ncbi:MAG: type II toxin-antitoxin system VapC family toxin [Pyrinomonadaceae bacterium]|nr:type II toxin-antitoxin system VapC family toxin [Pyrinomonadaceae bacterium]